MRQRGDERRIDGEVVVLDMTRATRPAVTLKPLFQEDLASLCNDFREIEVPCGSRRRVEPGRRARVIDKSHLAVKEPVENGGRTGQYERVQRTLARQRYESAIGKKVNELLRAEGREELVHSGFYVVRANLQPDIWKLGQRRMSRRRRRVFRPIID